MNWFCSQIGAREHYAVPRVLHRAGKLGALYTDFWAGPLVRGFAGATNAKMLRSLSTRFQSDLLDAPIVSWNLRSLFWENRLRKSEAHYGTFAEIGKCFAVNVRDDMDRRRDLNSNSIFFAYDTGALESLELCRERGVRCIVNQMDPNRVEVELVQEEEKQWPDWIRAATVRERPRGLEVPEEYFRRREKEWALADCVVVNSDFCRQALIKQNVPAEKIRIIPLSFESSEPPQGGSPRRSLAKTGDQRPPTSGPLRVLYLGQVILRKGIQYLVEAAKLMEGEPIQFDVVGPVGISESAVASAPMNMKFHGRATRDQTANWYRQSDVFVLPTLSDGFAITQLEALSYGLPVVATPCCGAVVSDGMDGFIVPQRDPAALAKTLQRYLAEPELLEQQSHAAHMKARQFTLDHLAANLQNLETAMQYSAGHASCLAVQAASSRESF